MVHLYTGSTQDIHAIDCYLEGVMNWIDELKTKYGISDHNGKVCERLKQLDCKSGSKRREGSNPSLSTNI